MLWVPPLCSWYFPDASIMLLVPLLVHGPSLMFLTPSQCSWYSRMLLDLPLRFGSPFSFRTPPPPTPPSSPHVLGIPVCSSTSRYDFGLPSVLEEKRKKRKKRDPSPPPRPHTIITSIHTSLSQISLCSIFAPTTMANRIFIMVENNDHLYLQGDSLRKKSKKRR